AEIVEVSSQSGRHRLQYAARDVAETSGEIQNQLRSRQRQTDGVADKKPKKQPVENAVESARRVSQSREEESIHEVRCKDDALDEWRKEPPRTQQHDRHRHVQDQVDDEEPLDDLLPDGLWQGHVLEPDRKVKVVGKDEDENRLDRQDDVALDRLKPERHLVRRRTDLLQ